MCGCREAGEDAGLTEEERAGADGEYGAFFVGVFLLEVREGFDKAEGFGFGFEDRVGAAAGDHEDVEFREARIGFFEVHVCAEGGALGGDGVFFGGDEGGSEGFGGWQCRVSFARWGTVRRCWEVGYGMLAD